MEALLACARSGVSTKYGTLYTTTFPCHNCEKHIAAAGIVRVVYVEPYPKSKALTLHGDSIALDNPGAEDRVRFVPFVGVAARRYFDAYLERETLVTAKELDKAVEQMQRTAEVKKGRGTPLACLAEAHDSA